MNRREFLQCAAVFASGAIQLPSSWAMSHEQKIFLTSQPNYTERESPGFFTKIQRDAVSGIADQIIPTTDTPGAIEAGTPRFIELMVADWFNAAERKLFMTGLADLQLRAGGNFASLSKNKQLLLLEKLEDESGDASWYQIGNVTRIWDGDAPFICQIKELTVLGFMLSHLGSTQFLRQNPMGILDGNFPLGNDDPAYAPELPIRIFSES